MKTLLLTDGSTLAGATADALRSAGAELAVLRDPGDRAIRRELESNPDSVAVVARDDVVALRLALIVEHFRPGIPLVVTVFDRTVAGELRRSVPGCRVVSLADIAAPTLADAGLAGEPPRRPPWPVRAFDQLVGAINPTYAGARILLAGLFGLLAIFVIDTLLLVTVLDLGAVDSIYGAARTLTTVAAEPALATGPGWLKLVSAAGMLLTIAFAALFPAGLVQRLLDPRLATVFGRRSIPRRDHVIVIGLGQVGLRLCTLLRELKVPVVGVEVDPDAPNVRLARGYGIPVVIGHGEDRGVLRSVSAGRARALAAVTSNELANVEIAVAA
ncbi:MAG: NAD-binding protein [Solirubrobacterales bacterium]